MLVRCYTYIDDANAESAQSDGRYDGGDVANCYSQTKRDTAAFALQATRAFLSLSARRRWVDWATKVGTFGGATARSGDRAKCEKVGFATV